MKFGIEAINLRLENRDAFGRFNCNARVAHLEWRETSTIKAIPWRNGNQSKGREAPPDLTVVQQNQ